MVLGILFPAMVAGFASATMALAWGHSVLFALVVYSGVGSVSVVALGLIVAVVAALRETSQPPTALNRTA